MHKNLSFARSSARVLFAVLLSSSSFFSVHAVAQTPPKPLGIGMVLVGPMSEPGWSYQHHQGLLNAEKALGTRIKTTTVEKVNEGPDAERVIRELAQAGNGLIITASFGYMEPTLRVAREFPNIKFVHVSGYKTAPNVATVNARFYEGRYLAGLAAGKLTKSNVLGYVAAFPIPEVVQGINAFTLGVRPTQKRKCGCCGQPVGLTPARSAMPLPRSSHSKLMYLPITPDHLRYRSTRRKKVWV
jgi:basic membrane protein A and related proteins